MPYIKLCRNVVCTGKSEELKYWLVFDLTFYLKSHHNLNFLHYQTKELKDFQVNPIFHNSLSCHQIAEYRYKAYPQARKFSGLLDFNVKVGLINGGQLI
jgi:hypothetical protein